MQLPASGAKLTEQSNPIREGNMGGELAFLFSIFSYPITQEKSKCVQGKISWICEGHHLQGLPSLPPQFLVQRSVLAVLYKMGEKQRASLIINGNSLAHSRCSKKKILVIIPNLNRLLLTAIVLLLGHLPLTAIW